MSEPDKSALRSTRSTSQPADDESPGVPGFRSWRGVYWFVFTCFVAAVLALTIFSRVFA